MEEHSPHALFITIDPGSVINASAITAEAKAPAGLLLLSIFKYLLYSRANHGRTYRCCIIILHMVRRGRGQIWRPVFLGRGATTR